MRIDLLYRCISSQKRGLGSREFRARGYDRYEKDAFRLTVGKYRGHSGGGGMFGRVLSAAAVRDTGESPGRHYDAPE